MHKIDARLTNTAKAARDGVEPRPEELLTTADEASTGKPPMTWAGGVAKEVKAMETTAFIVAGEERPVMLARSDKDKERNEKWRWNIFFVVARDTLSLESFVILIWTTVTWVSLESDHRQQNPRRPDHESSKSWESLGPPTVLMAEKKYFPFQSRGYDKCQRTLLGLEEASANQSKNHKWLRPTKLLEPFYSVFNTIVRASAR